MYFEFLIKCGRKIISEAYSQLISAENDIFQTEVETVGKAPKERRVIDLN
jgi:hypothetical protein